MISLIGKPYLWKFLTPTEIEVQNGFSSLRCWFTSFFEVNDSIAKKLSQEIVRILLRWKLNPFWTWISAGVMNCSKGSTVHSFNKKNASTKWDPWSGNPTFENSWHQLRLKFKSGSVRHVVVLHPFSRSTIPLQRSSLKKSFEFFCDEITDLRKK